MCTTFYISLSLFYKEFEGGSRIVDGGSRMVYGVFILTGHIGRYGKWFMSLVWWRNV